MIWAHQPSSRDSSRGDFSCSGRDGVRSARSPDGPIQSGGYGKADTGGQRIDDKVFQSRMPSGRPELQDFDESNSDNGKHRREQSMPGIGCAKCQSDQNERERMLAVLTEGGVRTEPRRSQRRERDGGGQKPGNYSEDGCHQEGISRFIDRISPHVKFDASVVNPRCRRS
jgi:hypothetical protein